MAKQHNKGLIVTETSCVMADCPITADQITATYSGAWPATQIFYYAGNDTAAERNLWNDDLTLNAAGGAYKAACEIPMVQ